MRKTHTLWTNTSLRALRAFEAAARYGSFTAAAEHLNVTQGAVSRQIKDLEALVGYPLFVRHGPRLILTGRGKNFAESLVRVFADLQQAFIETQGREIATTITLSMLPSVAARWLAARLEDFDSAFPEIDLKISASRHLIDFRVEQIDGAIRFGCGNWHDVSAEFIGAETICPICTPGFAARQRLKEPADLLDVRLFHGDMSEGWRDWFGHAGVKAPQGLRGPRLGDDAATLQAVLNGQGVALGRTLLVADDLAAGRLVQPFPLRLPIEFGYWFVTPRQEPAPPDFDSVRKWLIDRLRASLDTGQPG